ncbi:phosphatidylserine decarboxylase proenzyme-like protein, partial [Euroglyphus maynei]
MYRMLPLRTLSRVWGWVNSLELPQPVRIPILQSYAAAFGCDINEAFIEDLAQYKNLNEFFRRELKPGLRPIAGAEHDVVSPCDGTVLHMGSARDGLLEQVKGITYTMESFLGPITWKSSSIDNRSQSYQQCLLQNNDTDLYHCVIYLAPGDYHRFHSPVNWTVKYRRHFPGKLYSVRPTFASWFPNLFSVNERVAYIGEWQYGFFAMVPVGAVNVGSMRIYFDQDLRTNRTQMLLSKRHYEEKRIHETRLCKGDPFGEFNLGSTIVLIFEAPKAMR